MKYNDTKIRSVGDLITALHNQTDQQQLVWFRGQARSNWKLVPSLARSNRGADAEIALIKRFKQNAMPHINHRPQTEWEWLFLMQHYRVPTRLLDWTESPLTALFFAVEYSKKHENTEGAVWCLLPAELNKHANIEYKFGPEIPAFDHDAVLKSYEPTTIASEATSHLFPLAAIATRNSPRIVAQMGTFTITHRRMTPIENVADKKHVWRLTIPASSKRKIREELQLLRFTELTLFPELEQVANESKKIIS